MGGKTVTLRMIGQIAAMASFGMFVPCQYASLCLFEHIFISAGDEQSIDKGLSTFGAEIVGLKEAIKSSGTRSLILIDECRRHQPQGRLCNYQGSGKLS